MFQEPPPPLEIPLGSTTVAVSAIDSTLWLEGADNSQMYSPLIAGFGRVRAGCWSLYIRHPSGRNLLYDLGCRKDWENIPPACGIRSYMDAGILLELRVEQNVQDILLADGESLQAVEAVIWSHFHWDHTGDVSSFPPETRLIVGPGSRSAFMPGFPADPEAHTSSSDFAGREVVEIDFPAPGTPGALRIGGFRALDYFGDGSFYLLDSPGHAIGHLNALARTGVDEFVHLCGDSAHHCGEIRPSRYVPLPEGEIFPSPFGAMPCPGGLFRGLLPNGSPREHFLELQDLGAGTYKDQKYALIYDNGELKQTIRKVEGFDANENVFTVLAHDWTLKGVIDEWPKNLNGWRGKGWRKEVWWKFLADFKAAVVKENVGC